MRKIYFCFGDIINDKIVAVNGVNLSQPLTAAAFVGTQALGEWWVEKATNGTPVLCNIAPMFTDIELTVSGANINQNYTANSYDFIKAHPIHRPGK